MATAPSSAGESETEPANQSPDSTGKATIHLDFTLVIKAEISNLKVFDSSIYTTTKYH